MNASTPRPWAVLDLEGFLNLHLPDVGLRIVGRKIPSSPDQKGSFPYSFHVNNRSAASEALRQEALEVGDVYFACSTYRERNGRRISANVAAVRSLWLDLDTRELKTEAPYADKREAIKELSEFCRLASLPRPTLVDSGYGLHVYWPLSEDVTPDVWAKLAGLLKSAVDMAGLKADHTRTTDIASVLRAPGTMNRKEPANPRPVRLLYTGEPTPYADLHTALSAYIGSSSGAPSAPMTALSSNLVSGTGGDRWFARLSPDDQDSCIAQMLQVPSVVALADTSDSAPSPNWRTVLAACARSGAPNAKTLCREWAQTSGRFNAGDFDDRWESFARD